MQEPAGRLNPVEATGPFYLILGTSHDIQSRVGATDARIVELIDGLVSLIRDLVSRHGVNLIAEEVRHDCPTEIGRVAQGLGIKYLKIDIPAHLPLVKDVRDELDRRPVCLDAKCIIEYRCCRADDVRETNWLNEIEKTGVGPVLVVCGWAHVHFLAQKIESRGRKVAEERFFPPCFADGKVLPTA
ncbi:MAG: hypothetical protein ACLP1Y_14175 [Candidatus Acidiferrales bacterium]